jgi:hypothetical protein
MFNRNLVTTITLALFITVALSASALAQHGNKLPQDDDLSLLTIGQGIPDVGVVLKKKPGGQAAGNYRTGGDGKFNLGYLTPGVYSLTLNISADGADELEAEMARTYSNSKSNTAARAMVVLEGVKSMAVITTMEMQRNRFFGQAAPVFAQVYEIQFEVIGRQPVTGTACIVIAQPGVK